MTSATTTVSTLPKQHTASEITFSSNDKGLSVSIYTERLHIRSVQNTPEELTRYASLFGDAMVMQTLAAGKTKTKGEVQDSIKRWVKRWKDQDPYSGLAVFERTTNAFVGHVVLGHGESAGESEIAYLLHHVHWKQGYGSEAVAALVKEYALATMQRNYVTLDKKPLQKIVATARRDNFASCRILEKVGMCFVKDEYKYGALRHFYSIDIQRIQIITSCTNLTFDFSALCLAYALETA